MLRKITLPASADRGGALYLHSMPGRFEPLDEFNAMAREARVKHLLCLVGDNEIAAKSPQYLAAIRAGTLPFTLHRAPVPDYGLPEDCAALQSALREALGALGRGESVVIHCAAGIGRTGMAATLLLTGMGLDTEDAAARVRKAGASPDTSAQRDFVKRWHWTEPLAPPVSPAP